MKSRRHWWRWCKGQLQLAPGQKRDRKLTRYCFRCVQKLSDVQPWGARSGRLPPSARSIWLLGNENEISAGFERERRTPENTRFEINRKVRLLILGLASGQKPAPASESQDCLRDCFCSISRPNLDKLLHWLQKWAQNEHYAHSVLCVCLLCCNSGVIVFFCLHGIVEIIYCRIVDAVRIIVKRLIH